MFNLNSKLASISSHATSGWLTPRLQSVRPSFSKESGSLPDQEASNAFPPFHCWKTGLIRQYPSDYPTAILNFYRYLRKSAIPQWVSGQFSLSIIMFQKYLTLLGGGVLR